MSAVGVGNIWVVSCRHATGPGLTSGSRILKNENPAFSLVDSTI